MAMSSNEELVERMTSLEMKVAEQDRCISDLNSVILDQSKELKQLQTKLGKLEESLAKMDNTNMPYEKPPHY